MRARVHVGGDQRRVRAPAVGTGERGGARAQPRTRGTRSRGQGRVGGGVAQGLGAVGPRHLLYWNPGAGALLLEKLASQCPENLPLSTCGGNTSPCQINDLTI